MNTSRTLKNLTAETFKPYGNIIEFDGHNQSRFQVVVEEPETNGWRIAVSHLIRAKIEKLGLHPNTRESFEPLHGISAIFVAQKETPQDVEVFLLDQPICIYKNIWHATAALSQEAYIKITENLHVESLEYVLKSPLYIGMLDG